MLHRFMQDEGVQRDGTGDEWPGAKYAESIRGVRQRVGDEEQRRVEDEAGDKQECACTLFANQQPADAKYAHAKRKHDLNNE